MKLRLIKEDGTPKGAWIAVLVTVVWIALHVVAFFWECGAENLSRIDAEYTAGSIAFVSAYLLKKAFKGTDNEAETLPNPGGLFDGAGIRGDKPVATSQNITAPVRNRSESRPVTPDTD